MDSTMPMSSNNVREPISSATVVVVRDAPDEIEVLMVRRNAALEVHGDAWVFPGGRVAQADRGDAEIAQARSAALRETYEEVGITLRNDDLIPLAHWTTPVEFPKRFATWFFIAQCPSNQVPYPDGSEVVEIAWWTPTVALERVDGGLVTLAPPQYVTLHMLRCASSVSKLLTAFDGCEPERFVPRMARDGANIATLYHGDVMYAADVANLDQPGPRHRLWVHNGSWIYERDC